MIKKSKILIFFLILLIGIFEINIVVMNDDMVTATSRGNLNNTRNVKINIDEKAVQSKFQEIKDIPYNQKSMNCKNKSEMFADYLIQIGAKNIYVVVIEHKSRKYSHEVVEWNGHIYDACNNNELSYRISKDEYLKKLNGIGFNGITVYYPHVHHDS
ncbi:hypothetical protein [Methanobacterium sp. SMA-27]|uniref:hypothetical protein n=1 Tax=Methanobacterium sp. SMA-27 TaxID=1495336 RepID=UPI00064E32F5|nr:hypothetical protein [Methanobacterium sp. SMA-27]